MAQSDKPVLMFFGDSITAGYDLDPKEAFPAIIEQKMLDLGYDYEVINAGLSGEASAEGLLRVDTVLRTIPDIFVLELGANDGLRELDFGLLKNNLQLIINKVKNENPNVTLVVAGMEMPRLMGESYRAQFRQVFREVVEENNAYLIPFILEGVGGIPELNMADGIHPTAKGHLVIAETVWTCLKPLLKLKSDI
ncbi:MAG: arylesterase [Cyclobacteriaceae bacterium]